MNRAACTIVSRNYLPYARALGESYLKHYPDQKFYVLLVDRLLDSLHEKEPFELVLVEDLGIPNFASLAFRYDILELNTNVKATFLKSLLSRGVDQLLYFDPDILIYSNLEVVFDALDSVAIVLTPHSITPNSTHPAAEVDLLRTGIFNLGFLAVSNRPETLRFLNWWESRCFDFGYDDRQRGLFVDQKWANLIPCFFDSYLILKHPGYNVAYWNLHERCLTKGETSWKVNNLVPLVFYHFSGVTVDGGNEISKHSDQFDLNTRNDIEELFNDYRGRLIENGKLTKNSEPYAFGRFSDGTLVNRLQRAAFGANLDHFGSTDPFDSKGPFYAWAKRHHLQSCQDSFVRYNRKTYRKTDSKVRIVNSFFRVCLRVLGADKYSILMKYLTYVSQLRNQRDIFGDARP